MPFCLSKLHTLHPQFELIQILTVLHTVQTGSEASTDHSSPSTKAKEEKNLSWETRHKIEGCKCHHTDVESTPRTGST